MAGEDEEVVVTLPDEGTDGVVIEKGKAEVTPDKTIESASFNDDPMEDLKGQFATLTARASAAEQRASAAEQIAQQANQRAERVESEIVVSQLDTVKSGIQAAEAEASAAEQAYIAAVEAGDAAAMARSQRAIAKAEANIARLAEAKEDLEDEAKSRKDRPPQTNQRATQPQQTGSAIDRFVEGLSPKSAAWVRSHPEVVTDRKLNARMLAAHNLALAEDVAVESDEYFRRVEEAIKPKDSGERKVNGDGTRPSSAAASGGDRGGALRGGAREVRLTKGEADAATDGITLVWNYDDPTGKGRWKKGQAIGLVEMARRKAEGMKAGLYDKSYTTE